MKRRLLVTDVDNTLFDWVDIWFRSFTAMMDEVSRITGLPKDSLYTSIAQVHQRHGTSEYAFLLEEVPELSELYGDHVLQELAPAVDAFRAARNSALRLYPAVLDTLLQLSRSGVAIAAYTESMAFYTNYRFRKLGLDEVVDVLFSPPDHELPQQRELLRIYPPNHYKLGKTVHKHTPQGALKPNPSVLLSIISEMGASPDEVVYVGDSLMKDIAMAQEAGVFDVHAAYGVAQHREQYDLLRKVTHWTPEDVAREKTIMSRPHLQPTMVLESDFSPIAQLFMELGV